MSKDTKPLLPDHLEELIKLLEKTDVNIIAETLVEEFYREAWK